MSCPWAKASMNTARSYTVDTIPPAVVSLVADPHVHIRCEIGLARRADPEQGFDKEPEEGPIAVSKFGVDKEAVLVQPMIVIAEIQCLKKVVMPTATVGELSADNASEVQWHADESGVEGDNCPLVEHADVQSNVSVNGRLHRAAQGYAYRNGRERQHQFGRPVVSLNIVQHMPLPKIIY